MTIEDLLKDARVIWGDTPMELDHITIALGVVYGDICRQARIQKEAGTIDGAELKKEMGNLIFSLIRWCDDLGYSPNECLELARQAQQQYTSKIIK